jgi:hypothetical protein
VRDGAPFVGLVVPNAYEMDPVLRSPSFKPSDDNPFLAEMEPVILIRGPNKYDRIFLVC